jgi:hypothetical protein
MSRYSLVSRSLSHRQGVSVSGFGVNQELRVEGRGYDAYVSTNRRQLKRSSMDFLKRIRNAVLIIVAVCAFTHSLSAQTTPTSVWGATVNGLQLSLSLDPSTEPSSHTPAITLSLRNVGTDDLTVALGTGCGPMPPLAVELDVIGSSPRETFRDLGSGSCAGVVWNFTKSLPPGASFSIPLMLYSYRTKREVFGRTIDEGWQPGGTYILQAVLKIPNTSPQVGYWEGTVTSNQLEVHFPTP